MWHSRNSVVFLSLIQFTVIYLRVFPPKWKPIQIYAYFKQTFYLNDGFYWVRWTIPKMDSLRIENWKLRTHKGHGCNHSCKLYKLHHNWTGAAQHFKNFISNMKLEFPLKPKRWLTLVLNSKIESFWLMWRFFLIFHPHCLNRGLYSIIIPQLIHDVWALASEPQSIHCSHSPNGYKISILISHRTGERLDIRCLRSFFCGDIQ